MTPSQTSRSRQWDDTYARKGEMGVSWYQDRPSSSLDALDRGGVSALQSLVDVGAGASTLVDALLERGHRDVTVLDLSEQALALCRARLAARAALVSWRCEDLLTWVPERTFDVWHDRAVFHFLTTSAEREQYRAALTAATHERSVAVVAAFATDGPTTCSGLPVCRYSADDLAAELPPGFTPVATWGEDHRTPWQAVQPLTWLVARRER